MTIVIYPTATVCWLPGGEEREVPAVRASDATGEELRMRYKIWGNGSGGPAARGANREVDLESVVIGADAPIAAPARSRPRHRLRLLGLVGAVLAILSGGAWVGRYWWSAGRYIETTDDAYVGGNVTAIAPHVHGFVAQVLVADNERVHAPTRTCLVQRSDDNG
jgi:hypothetical protein